MLQLHIGNKNYSSWSMRPWVAMRQVGIGFDEVLLRFDGGFASDSPFKRSVARVSPTGRVPVLVDDGFAVWDTLAIAEYLAERFPERGLWPADARQRARARSLCAEMHAGFTALRSHCPMNIEACLPAVGARVVAEQPAVVADLDRIASLWSEQLAASGGPLLFGGFTMTEAYFAPVACRVRTYALPLPAAAAGYAERLLELSAVHAWIDDALAERDFLSFEEPYRASRD